MRSARMTALAVAVAVLHAACGNDKDEVTYTITIDPDPVGGTITLDPAAGPYEEGTTVTVAAVADSDRTFTGWGGDLSGTNNPEILTMDDDKVITATFTAGPTYTVTIDPVPTGGSIELDPGAGPHAEGAEVTVTAVPDSGATFTGWGGDLSGTTNPETLTMDSDKTITATFTTGATYTITIDPAPTHGIITLDPATGPYAEGTDVTVTAEGDVGYVLEAWSGDLTGTTNPETLTMDSDKTISATFVYSGDVYVREDGLDTNPGTPEEPVATIARGFEIIAADDGEGIIHIAAGTYEVDSGAGTHVVAVEGVSLYGGYSATDWTDRDVSNVYEDTAHQSIIRDMADSGAVSIVEAARTIFVGAGITPATVFDGLYIRGGQAGAQNTTGVYVDEGTPTITNTYINGGGGTYTTALYTIDVTGMVFSHNHVIGGDMVDTESTGIYSEFSTLTITDNIIDGGCGGGDSSFALDIQYMTDTVISGNTIIGGTGGNAYGVVIDGDSNVTLTGNVIHASNDTSAGGEMVGVLAWSSGTLIANNVLNINGVLDPHHARGIEFSNNDTVIVNNTLQVSSLVAGDVYGIVAWSAYSGTVVENNIVTSETAWDYSYAVALGEVASFANNDMHGFQYFTWLGSDVADLDTTTITTDAGTGTLASFGNVSIDLIDATGTDHYVDPDGADDDITTTEDNDFHLGADAAILDVREGGLDQTGLAGFPVDASSDPVDLEGTPRTAGATTATNPGAAGWSMGAYEQD